jgi:DNA-binding XRE family transcriptional regulator
MSVAEREGEEMTQQPVPSKTSTSQHQPSARQKKAHQKREAMERHLKKISPEASSLQVALALNLRVQRRARKLTQEQFADLCGLHRTYIGAIERGERNITLSTLALIAHAIELEPAVLLKPAL